MSAVATQSAPSVERRVAPNPLTGRGTPLSARGEPLLWLMGLSLALCVVMIVGLISMIVFQGFTTFWPRPIDKVTLADGRKFLGIPIRDEPFDPGESESKHLEAIRATAGLGAFDAENRPIRRLYRTGNKEIGAPFRWVTLADITNVERPPLAIMLERREWGVWLGEPRSVISIRTVGAPASGAPTVWDETIPTASGTRRVTRRIERTDSDGARIVRESTYLTSDANDAWGLFQRLHSEAVKRHGRIEHLTKFDIGSINRRMDDWRLKVKAAEIERARTESPHNAPMLGTVGFVATAIAIAGVAAGALGIVGRRSAIPLVGMIATRALWCAVVLGVVFLALEHPWSGPRMSAERLAAIKLEAAERTDALQREYSTVLTSINELREEESRERVEFVEPSQGSFAPLRQSSPDDPLMISQVVRAVPANALTFPGKVSVYLDRWREFLFDDPREANTEGGVFPVIFGTVLLTLLLSLVVVPLGVIAALYLREYAKQGPLTSAVRITRRAEEAPVFGLGFFCYSVGKLDQRPGGSTSRQQRSTHGDRTCNAVAPGSPSRCLPVGRAPAKPPIWHRSRAGCGRRLVAAPGVVTLKLSGTPHFHGLLRYPALNTIGTRGLSGRASRRDADVARGDRRYEAMSRTMAR